MARDPAAGSAARNGAAPPRSSLLRSQSASPSAEDCQHVTSSLATVQLSPPPHAYRISSGAGLAGTQPSASRRGRQRAKTPGLKSALSLILPRSVQLLAVPVAALAR